MLVLLLSLSLAVFLLLGVLAVDRDKFAHTVSLNVLRLCVLGIVLLMAGYALRPDWLPGAAAAWLSELPYVESSLTRWELVQAMAVTALPFLFVLAGAEVAHARSKRDESNEHEEKAFVDPQRHNRRRAATKMAAVGGHRARRARLSELI